MQALRAGILDWAERIEGSGGTFLCVVCLSQHTQLAPALVSLAGLGSSLFCSQN
jgi:hypothetical protein